MAFSFHAITHKMFPFLVCIKKDRSLHIFFRIEKRQAEQVQLPTFQQKRQKHFTSGLCGVNHFSIALCTTETQQHGMQEILIKNLNLLIIFFDIGELAFNHSAQTQKEKKGKLQ